MDSLTPHLFVYGTLRREYEHPLYTFLLANGISLGRATTEGTLLAVSYYPALILRRHGEGRVIGELFRLRNSDMILQRLDRYQRSSRSDPQPHPFRKSIISVRDREEQQVQAWAWLWNQPAGGFEVIESGDYIQWWNERGRPRNRWEDKGRPGRTMPDTSNVDE
jgi:gamma-glutamylcyclotransferase (GGCT)/AIG2-like uncharacterized protein YtfP